MNLGRSGPLILLAWKLCSIGARALAVLSMDAAMLLVAERKFLLPGDEEPLISACRGWPQEFKAIACHVPGLTVEQRNDLYRSDARTRYSRIQRRLGERQAASQSQPTGRAQRAETESSPVAIAGHRGGDTGAPGSEF